MMKPKLRPLEITAIEHEGEEYFYCNDRLGIAPGAAIPRAWGGLLALFDGKRDLPDIIFRYSLQHGEVLPREVVERIVMQLDEALLLESPRFWEYHENLVREFQESRVRTAAMAGASYAATPEKLRAQLAVYFEEAAKIKVAPLPPNAKVRGVIVPHIDFQRGGATEALAYSQLLGNEFDVFIVLGIAHACVRYPFCAANKDFQTPLGTSPCDRRMLSDFQNRLGDKMLAEEYAHKNEHSIEFVAVFLQFLEKFKQTPIVPIICGGFFDELRSGKSPLENPEINEFIAALREVVSTHEAAGRRVGLIASVDLAHVGSRFGDDQILTAERRRIIHAEDLQFLRCLESGDAEIMHAALAKDNNARNIDAHPAVYAILAAFPELRAQLLDYRQTFDHAANSLVSFAAMTLYEI